MRVAIVTSFPRDLSKPQGGVEAVSVNLAKALSELDGLDIHVVTCDSTVSSADTTSLSKVTVHRLPAPKGSMLVNAITTGRRAVCDYLRMLKPEVVHSHDTYGLMVKGLSLPRVFTVHGFIYGDTLVSGARLPWLRAALWKLAETRGWADQPHIISISPYVRERISGFVKGTIHDIENPIAESFFKVERQEKPGVIFSAAVIAPRKNTLALVDAIVILARQGVDVRLRLAGKVVDPDYGKAVQARIDANGLRENVVLLGSIGLNQVQAELAQASMFALASLEENAPLGIEEAMAVGVPVVASNRCGMPYMVRHGETGFLVNPFDPHSIASRIRQLLRSQSLRETMGERSREFALERFHPDRVAALTREVYREAFEKKSVCGSLYTRFGLSGGRSNLENL